MNKTLMLGGASVVAIGLMFGSSAFAHGIQADGNAVALANGAAGGSNAGYSNAQSGNAASGNGYINDSSTKNVGATDWGAATSGGTAGNAVAGSAAGEGQVWFSNNAVVDNSQKNAVFGWGNIQANGNATVGSNNKKTVGIVKAQDGSALSASGDATALTAKDGGVVQSGIGSSAITQSNGWVNIGNDAQVNYAHLSASVSNIHVGNFSGDAVARSSDPKDHKKDRNGPPIWLASTNSDPTATSGYSTFSTGSLNGVSVGSGARGVYALAGSTGIAASQNADIGMNSDITGGTGNMVVGGGYTGH